MAPVSFDDSLAERQPDAGARVSSDMMKPLKDDEDSIRVLRLKPNAVVLDGKEPVGPFSRGFDIDLGRRVGLAEFQRICDQILEDDRELGGIGFKGWKSVDRDLRFTFGDGQAQVVFNVFQYIAHTDLPDVDGLGA